jgi:hypothetical protein
MKVTKALECVQDGQKTMPQRNIGNWRGNVLSDNAGKKSMKVEETAKCKQKSVEFFSRGSEHGKRC